jgi:hypothetical protein
MEPRQQRGLVIAATRLLEDPGEQRTLHVHQVAVDVLFDGDGHEVGVEQLADHGVLQARRTVEHPVVSDTPERVAVM